MIGDVYPRLIAPDEWLRIMEGETIELLPPPGKEWCWRMEADGSFSLVRSPSSDQKET